MGVCILDLVSLLWGSGYILPHGGLLVFSFLGDSSPRDHFFHIWCSRVVAFFISLSRSLFLYFFGVKAWGFGFTVYDDMHWAEGKYQAFWWDGQLGDSTEKGGEAFCFV